MCAVPARRSRRSHARPAPRAVQVLLVAGATACGAERAPAPEPSAAIFRGRVDLTVGSAAGEDPYLFGRISGIARDASGRIFVADLQANEIRAFDSTGAFLFRIGREGEGPGELREPCCLGLDETDRLWVRDNGNARYDVFAPGEEEAEFVTSVPFRGGAMNLWAPVTFDGEGRVVDVGMRSDPGGALPATLRLHTTLDGVAEDTVAIANPPADALGLHTVDRPTDDGAARFYVWQPYAPRHLIAHGPGGAWAEALGSSYRVEWHRGDGTAITIEGPNAPGPELSERERTEAEERMASERERLGIRTLPFGVPDRKPPLRDLFFDTEGRLWVELSVRDGADREADVYTEEGTPAGRYTWPAEVRPGLPGWTGASSLLGVTVDSLGVQRAARVRFERTP